MANFSAKILGNSISGLTASQAVIANASNNIANVNTPGFTKRTVQLEARQSAVVSAGVQIGSGVDVGEVERLSNAFLERLVRSTSGDYQSALVQDGFLSRVESLFDLTGEYQTVGTSLNAFYDALNDLGTNPASIELRSNLLERAEDLVANIRQTFDGIASLQTEADGRLDSEINSINSLTQKIADLNAKVSAIEAGGHQAADARDTRAQLLNKLAEKISFDTVEANDGTVNVYLANGFSLVANRQANALEVNRNPSFITTAPAQALDGGGLGYIVFDYSGGTGNQHIDLTDQIAAGEGSVGGLLKIRGYNYTDTADNAFTGTGALLGLAEGIEGITRELLTTFNTAYLGPIRTGAAAVGNPPSAGDLNGNPPALFGMFTVDNNGATVVDSNGSFTPDVVDLQAATGTTIYSSMLKVTETNPARVAAGIDVTAAPANPLTDPLTIAKGDGRNLQRLVSDLEAGKSYTMNNFTASSVTYRETYDLIASNLGNLRNNSTVNVQVSEANHTAAQIERDQLSQVSLDEEFTRLIQFQKSYEANARLIRIADQLLEQIVSLI